MSKQENNIMFAHYNLFSFLSERAFVSGLIYPTT